ncbi:uncharacterized protein LOC128213267 isoform X2 [Mya arenaria]|uniref:uncharacterized protein LOC128213267 isoform X2 n=1 Tax=Mya arenaria TaxID=6604 RepID=UPI0022DFE9A5|nr:uncharacterized protein LOC128213267 isoform X2 [Mya arenaria]
MELCALLEIIKSIFLVVFLLHSVRTARNFNYLSVENRCIKDCNYLRSIPNVTFNCDGDNSSCDWQCAAQRMGCDVGLIYHCAPYLRNHDLNLNQMENIETCAPEKFCNAGEEPYVTFMADGAVGSHKKAMIKCLPCKNPNFYNSRAGQSSASYSRCYQLKVNKCIPEEHKIDCGDISWRTRKETDGLCRCAAGHAPANENVNTTCFNSNEICVPKTCAQSNQELLSDYTCGDKCPSGMHRTGQSDDCVPNMLVQTTKKLPTILTSQRSTAETEKKVAISTTTDTKIVLSTAVSGEMGNANGSDKNTDFPIIIGIMGGCIGATFLVVLSIVIIFKCKTQSGSRVHEQSLTKGLHEGTGNCRDVGATGGLSPYTQNAATGTRSQAYDQHQVYGSDPSPFTQPGFNSFQTTIGQRLANQISITLYYNSKTINETVTHIAGDQVKVTSDNSNVQTGSGPTESSPQEIEETSFSKSLDHKLLRSDREVDNQSDSETPLLSGYEKNHPLESSGNTSTVMIKERDENAGMNTGSCQSPSDGVDGSAVADDDITLQGSVFEGKIPAKTLS